MRWPGFVGPTYTLHSRVQAYERCINLYPELNELQNGKDHEIAALIGTPGLKKLATVGSGPIRGLYYTSTGRLAVVSGAEVYRVDSSWVATRIGNISESTGRVSMADNGTQLIIVSGGYGYIVSLVTGTLQQIDSASFVGATHVAFQDGYFILNSPGTGQFYVSSLYDGLTYNGFDYATAEGSPGALIGHISINRRLWLFGADSTEIWWNAGTSSPPFSRIDGGFINIGCGAAYTIANLVNNPVWLGNNGIIYVADGISPRRISNHAVEIAIMKAGNYSTAYAYTYSQDGHNFYAITLPGASSTWVYDLMTGQWHERTWTTANGVYEPHRAATHAYAYGVDVVGDRADGRIYALDTDTNTDDGGVITRERIPTRLSADLQRLFLSKLQVDMEVGVGLDDTAQGTDPQCMLQVSHDGGRSWGSELWRPAGKIGTTLNRVIWRRLGNGRDTVVRFKITDPVKIVILGASVDAEAGVY